ncbi:MAG: hypothetical protein J5493_00900 [Lachnospiraceae bacterium]|nr:hypothetical protein [Lachnospiraceae bacterium]
MDNPVIQSILEEEAQAALELSAARDQAQALIRETQERLKQEKKQAEAQAAARLEDARREADELSARIGRKAEEEAMTARAVLKVASARKMDRAAEAVLSYLR